MSREPHLDIASSKETEAAFLKQNGLCQPVDAGRSVKSDNKKPNEEIHLSHARENDERNIFDTSVSQKKNFFKSIIRSAIFIAVVLIALAPPISTLAAIIYGSIYGFSWVLVFIPMLTWILTGLLTVRLMIYKTGITFKR